MSMFMDTTTGEIYSGSISSVDGLIETITATERKINELRLIASEAKSKLCAMAKFNSGVKTARIQGEKYRCKVELPSKMAWNQKKLSQLYHNNPFPKEVISIKDYKINLREYKNIINTSYCSEEFNKFQQGLIEANLGYVGTPRVTIEETKCL